MNWLVAGAGAIGSVVGGLLAEAGEAVWLLGRAPHLTPIKEKGLKIRGILGEHCVTQCGLCVDVEELPRQRWDTVLVTVKSHDTDTIIRQISPHLSNITQVVSLQNGLGNWEALLRHLPAAQVIGGRVIFGAEMTPGTATVTVWGGNILLGRLAPKDPQAPARRIAERLTQAGLKTEMTDRIREALWSKVIYNCALNPLSTLLKVPYGQLLEAEDARQVMTEVVAEAYQVAEAEGIALEPATAEGYRTLLFEKLIPRTAAHHPSMLQDIQAGRRTEIDALNGALVRIAARHGIALPANAKLTQRLQRLSAS